MPEPMKLSERRVGFNRTPSAVSVTVDHVPIFIINTAGFGADPPCVTIFEQTSVSEDDGSGGGIDVLLSARRVGPSGKAYGLDMTPQMLELARKNQAEAGLANVEFLQGTIEDIPLPDETVDV